jgi:hypothetical protein
MRLRFSGPPGPEAPTFIEAEDQEGNSVRIGKWQADSESSDWFLVLNVEPTLDRIEELFSEIKGDFTDPRHECREGWNAVACLRVILGVKTLEAPHE